MFFSEKFNVNSELIESYGAIDISLVCDVPLFVDPMLIFNSNKPEYKALHEGIIKFFHFLYKKAEKGLTKKEIGAWFNFKEVPNNWLGYSLVGNKGLALGQKYAEFLYHNIAFAINTNGLTRSSHIEKIMLLYEGSGKDKISDLTVNLIKSYLCEYTEKFAIEHIDSRYLKRLPVEKAYFNYETESFVSKEYTLPYIYNEDRKIEYVLLTPYDLLREDEPAINKRDFLDSYDLVRMTIENEALRAYVNNYLSKAVRDYEEEQKKNKKIVKEKSITKIEKQAFMELVQEYPILYDYYIRYKEKNADLNNAISKGEVEEQLQRLIVAAKSLLSAFDKTDYKLEKNCTAREEAKRRIKYFKHIIEECDGYKNLYVNGNQIARENDLQRLFKFVWYGTNFKVDAEVNNGRGYADFIVSMGQEDQNIIEFKLARNSKLAHVFTQVKIYEAANCAEGSLVVIFYFSEEEYSYAKSVVSAAGYEALIDEAIFLIDCRNDNKSSASKV